MFKKDKDLIEMECDIIQSLIEMENVALAIELKILTRRELQRLQERRRLWNGSQNTEL